MTAPKIQIKPAALLSATPHTLPSRLLVTELFFSVPLNHNDPSGRQIKVFCRSAERPPPALSPSSFTTNTPIPTFTSGNGNGKDTDDDTGKRDASDTNALPYLVFITGGPGFPCPAPQDMLSLTNFVLDKGYKLLCFDHRGFGMSCAITARSLERDVAARGDGEEEERKVSAKVEFLKMFRATEAVRDLEAIRLCLRGDAGAGGIARASGAKGDDAAKWSIMGQSYGGYLATTYLSFYPEGLREVWLLGGLPPVLERKPDNVIKGLVGKVRERNDRYYAKYPEDLGRVKRVVEYLRTKQKEGKAVILPTGGTLSAGRFLELGLLFGFHGGLDSVHNLVLRVSRDLSEDGEISRPALGVLERQGGFDEHVFYAVMHEALYCQGEAPDWAFDRVVRQEKDFGVDEEKERYLFTGEMVFKRAFDDYVELRGFKTVMDRIMKADTWADQYDVQQLKKNDVPVFAAVFVDDMYVGFESSLTTAKMIRGCKTVVTNQLYHDAVRAKPDEVLKALFALRDDAID